MKILTRPAANQWGTKILACLAHWDWKALAAFGLPFILYSFTVAPTIYNLDSAELTTAAATGGLVRATGYPLYLLLGRLWSWLPIGDVGYRMNLFSAFCGALTVLLVERVLRRWQVGLWATLGALGLLATALHFWALSLIAEVYTLHTVLMLGLILSLLYWAERPTPRRLLGVGLMAGLGLSHHVATVLLLPGCAWYVVTVAPRQAFKPHMLFAALAGMGLGLSLYLYLPWQYGAAPAFNYAGLYDATGHFQPINLRSWEGLEWLVTGRAFAGQMLAYHGIELWREVVVYSQQLWRAFFAVGIGPGLLGLIVLLRRDWRLGGLLLMMFAGSAAFYIDYRVIDKETMFLPTYVIWALWLGMGYQWLLDSLRGREHEARTTWPWGRWLAQGVMLSVVLVALGWNWRLVNLSDDWSTRQRGEAILHQAQPNAIIFGWWDTVPVIEYLQLVEGQRPDVQAINRFLIPYDAMQQLIEQEAGRRPIYIDNVSADLLRIFNVEPVPPLYRLKPQSGP